MRRELHRSLAAAIVTLSVTVWPAAAAKPAGSALDDVPGFIAEIERAGFSSQEAYA